MNLNKVSKQLRKINNLVESLREDNHVSNIEKDLLLSYTRSLYEKILDNDTAKSQDSAASTPEFSPKKEDLHRRMPTKASVEEITRKEMDTVETATASPSSAPVYRAPVESSTSAPSHKESEQQQETNIATATEAASTTQVIEGPMKVIFAEVKANELSERLSHAPISDLTKSMGINEKILTVSELFGGDNSLYNSTLERLNSFNSFEQAKLYLANGVAKDYHWEDKDKMDKAITFVKLVQRRYA